MNKELYAKQILNTLLGESDKAYATVFSIVTPDDFGTYSTHAACLHTAWSEGSSPAVELQKANLKLTDLLVPEAYLAPSQLKRTAELLKKEVVTKIVQSTLIKAGSLINSENIDTELPALQQKLLTTTLDTAPEDAGVDTIIEEFKTEQAAYEEKKKTGQELIGDSTGIKQLDEIIDGLRPGHLWVLGGYTNTGKTFAAMNIVANLAKQKQRTVFFSLEMSRTDILARLLGVLSSQNGLRIKKSDDDKGKTAEALKIASDSHFSCYSGNNDKDIATIINTMHAECVKNKPALFVIDFIQLVQVKGSRSEYESMTTAALALQTAGQKFGVPIIVLSQVSNDAAKAGDTQVMGFKGSGGIAAAADLAIELVSGEESVKELKQKMMKGEPVNINWQVKKNRHGRVGTIPMKFTGITGTFEYADPDNY